MLRIPSAGVGAEGNDRRLAIHSLFSARAAMKKSGCTYRQLDYWQRTGLILSPSGGQGSGTARGFSYREIEVMRALAVASGLGINVHSDLGRAIAQAVRDHGLTDSAQVWDVCVRFDPGALTLTDS